MVVSGSSTRVASGPRGRSMPSRPQIPLTETSLQMVGGSSRPRFWSVSHRSHEGATATRARRSRRNAFALVLLLRTRSLSGHVEGVDKAQYPAFDLVAAGCR